MGILAGHDATTHISTLKTWSKYLKGKLDVLIVQIILQHENPQILEPLRRVHAFLRDLDVTKLALKRRANKRVL